MTEILVAPHTRKKKTKREEKLKDLPARIIEHKPSDKELQELSLTDIKSFLMKPIRGSLLFLKPSSWTSIMSTCTYLKTTMVLSKELRVP